MEPSKPSRREAIGSVLIVISIWLVLVPAILLAVIEGLDYLHVTVGHDAMAFIYEHGGMTLIWSYIGYMVLWPFIATAIGISMMGNERSLLKEFNGLPIQTKVWKIIRGLLIAGGAVLFVVLLTSNADSFNH